METIKLSSNIARLRREQGLTQEALATRVGVTKAAVSKWELAQSLPDVALLPRVASLLGVSVDELIGYEPQLSEGELRTLQDQLDELAGAGNRSAAHKLLEREVREHASCWPLLLMAAANLMGWAVAATEKDGPAGATAAEASSDCRERAAELIDRILDRARDAGTLAEAQQLKAALLMQEGQLDEAEALLRPLMPRGTGQSVPMLLMGICQARGNREEALELNQRQLLGAVSSLVWCLEMQVGMRENAGEVEELARAARQVMEALGWDRTNPLAIASLSLTAAQACLRLGAHEKALDRAEQALDAAPARAGAQAGALGELLAFDHLAGALGDSARGLAGTSAESCLAPAVAELLEDAAWTDADGVAEARRQALLARARA